MTMQDALTASVHYYFSDVARAGSEDNYSRHLDELLGSDYVPSDVVAHSLIAYTKLVRLFAARADELVATLVIPPSLRQPPPLVAQVGP
jgi:hypothetical protein